MTLIRSLDPVSGVPIFLPLISLADHEARKAPKLGSLSLASLEALDAVLSERDASFRRNYRTDARRMRRAR